MAPDQVSSYLLHNIPWPPCEFFSPFLDHKRRHDIIESTPLSNYGYRDRHLWRTFLGRAWLAFRTLGLSQSKFTVPELRARFSRQFLRVN